MWHNLPRESGYAELPADSDADRMLYAPEPDYPGFGLFGVFDGVGSTGAPAAARATMYINARDCDNQIVSVRGLVTALEGANTAILEDPAARIDDKRRSETTATVAVVLPTLLGARAVWASVGDSRLYHVSQRGTAIEQITRDEGEGKRIYNGLGWTGCRVKQHGSLKLRRGDGLILVTDGVTGDYDDDIMQDNEVLNHYRAGFGDATVAAENLVHNARKRDDRTAIVVQL